MRGLRQDDFFAVKVRFLRVHDAVKWGIFFAGDTFAGVEHGVKSLAGMVGKAAALVERFSMEPVVEQKINGGTQSHVGGRKK